MSYRVVSVSGQGGRGAADSTVRFASKGGAVHYARELARLNPEFYRGREPRVVYSPEPANDGALGRLRRRSTRPRYRRNR